MEVQFHMKREDENLKPAAIIKVSDLFVCQSSDHFHSYYFPAQCFP